MIKSASMDTVHSTQELGRKTNADKVFDSLKSDIIQMRLLPGTKLSEAVLAAKFGFSRQPVREALIRLDDLRLVRVRPQKATTVRKISRIEITHLRFARLAIELEMARQAVKRYEGEHDKAFSENLRLQGKCLKTLDLTRFNGLDFDFHHLVSQAARAEFAFQSIVEAKIATDRLSLLAMRDRRTMSRVYDDHRAIYDALTARDEDALVDLLKAHLGRVGETLSRIEQTHTEYLSD